MPDAELTADQAERRKIIRRYARLKRPDGNPKFCHAGVDEIKAGGRTGAPRRGKMPVIFDSVEAAQACEQELRALDGLRQYVYPCPRSRSGHVHLSARPPG